MEQEEPGAELPPALTVMGAWQTTVVLGVITLVLGLIVTFYPSATLNVIAVLIGILLIVSGLFHLIRVFGNSESHRVWLGISGLLLIVVGVVLIRHLDLTVGIIGLIVGISWIVQGISALAAGFSGALQEGRGWWIFFGFISLIGGIVIAVVPVASVTALAVLIGLVHHRGLDRDRSQFHAPARGHQVPVTAIHRTRAGEGSALGPPMGVLQGSERARLDGPLDGLRARAGSSF
jgi:uncharacterized membrane protein HdeD (DUF308 family)